MTETPEQSDKDMQFPDDLGERGTGSSSVNMKRVTAFLQNIAEVIPLLFFDLFGSHLPEHQQQHPFSTILLDLRSVLVFTTFFLCLSTLCLSLSPVQVVEVLLEENVDARTSGKDRSRAPSDPAAASLSSISLFQESRDAGGKEEGEELAWKEDREMREELEGRRVAGNAKRMKLSCECLCDQDLLLNPALESLCL